MIVYGSIYVSKISIMKIVTPEAKLGMLAIDFKLLGVDQKQYNLENASGKNGLLVMFICNHCPYVQEIIDQIVTDTKDLLDYFINSIAIMPNDVINYPQDSFDNMRNLSDQKNFSFPYVIDSDQTVARAYGAVCTPDFFGFDQELKLKYRGRLRGTNDERELFNVMINTTGNNNNKKQHPSQGCSIKWVLHD